MTTDPAPAGLPAQSPLAPVLERNRAKYNAWFAAAARAGGAIDPGEFSSHLLGTVRAVAEAVHAIDPARLETVTDTLLSISLELFGKAQLGGKTRTPQMAELWGRVLPDIPRRVVEAPRALVAGLSNVLSNVAAESAAAGARWLEEVREIAPMCESAADLLRAAMVLAWRSGLPHYRASALELWWTLPETLRRRTLGATADTSLAELESGLADPWWRPGLDTRRERSLALVGVAGNFRGFGGRFMEPPLVGAVAGTLFAYDASVSCSLYADAFGTSLRPLRKDPTGTPDTGTSGFTIDERGNVRCGRLQAALPRLAGALSSAALPHLLAVTLPNSHRVYLVAPVWSQA